MAPRSVTLKATATSDDLSVVVGDKIFELAHINGHCIHLLGTLGDECSDDSSPDTSSDTLLPVGTSDKGDRVFQIWNEVTQSPLRRGIEIWRMP
jgi:hypothetical protein